MPQLSPWQPSLDQVHVSSRCIPISTPSKCKRVRSNHLPTSNTSTLLTPSPGCAEVVAALEECHARGFLWKVTGNCSEAKYKVNMCLRGLRLERTRLNREAAKEKREKIKQAWAELDANK